MNRLDDILKRLEDRHGIERHITAEELAERKCEAANRDTGNLHEQDGYDCTVCKNKGVVYFMKDTEFGYKCMTQKQCECMKIRRTLKRAKASGLNNILTDYTFAKYEATEEWQKDIKSKAQEFCNNEAAQWFYIGGQTGAGKTHICTAICGHYIKSGKDCRYMLWRDDAVKLKQLVNDYTEYQRLIEEYKQVDVLYIDDLFKSQSGAEPTKADINIAFELLNNRLMDKGKITVISSEFSILDALQFDEATIGRIYQHTGQYKIEIPKDIRKNYRLKG